MSTVDAKNDIADSSGRQPTTQRSGPLDLATIQRNPLRQAADRRLPRVPEPCALVVFGVTGDLSRKKLLPAVYDLANRGLLPTDFVLLGFARRDWGDGDFEDLAKKSAKDQARTNWSDEVWNRLSGRVKFVPGAFDDDAAFGTLNDTLNELCKTHGINGNAASRWVGSAVIPLSNISKCWAMRAIRSASNSAVLYSNQPAMPSGIFSKCNLRSSLQVSL